ncbi:MAG TPA: hypothetical protein VGP68_10490 [Gemmataceae bacterium]|nr:hypothetical protein [Gemmataceae bacterium]
MGISFGQSHWSGPDDDQTRQPQSVDKMFGANAGETQLEAPRIPSDPGDGVTENGGDFRVGQFVVGYLERHGGDDSRTGVLGPVVN